MSCLTETEAALTLPAGGTTMSCAMSWTALSAIVRSCPAS